MTVKKFVGFCLIILLLVIINVGGVYWYFHQCVYNFPIDGDITQLGEEYQGATVLHDDYRHVGDRYITVKTASGETHLLVMGYSPMHTELTGRYQYLPGSTVVIPDERPYTCTLRTSNSALWVKVDASDHVHIQSGISSSGASTAETVERLLPCLLLALELSLWWLISRFMKKKRSKSGT